MDLESGVDFTPLGSAPPSRPMQLRQNQLQRGKKKARTMNPLIQLKQTIALFLVAFGLSHTAQAISPAPDGGYPGGNTAEGDQALFNLTSGLYNTAMGAQVLLYNSTGSNNTAIGTYALVHNEMANNNTAIGSMAMMGPNGVITTGNQNTAFKIIPAQTTILRTDFKRSFTTRLAQKTRPLVSTLFSITPLAHRTSRWAQTPEAISQWAAITSTLVM
jgi:hypothetical protein